MSFGSGIFWLSVIIVGFIFLSNADVLFGPSDDELNIRVLETIVDGLNR